ncbi:hypothetical protein SEA_MACGULLY_12 [Rhodococcus phage MacGully]|nr:hypothetical protein SEA_MACGULLY_12 [Rhodococcus phage MacGully]
MIKVGRRPSPIVGQPAKRASLVGCDFPFCDKALEFPVNLHATDAKCKNDTIRYMKKNRPNGWFTDGKLFYCKHHAELKGAK